MLLVHGLLHLPKRMAENTLKKWTRWMALVFTEANLCQLIAWNSDMFRLTVNNDSQKSRFGQSWIHDFSQEFLEAIWTPNKLVMNHVLRSRFWCLISSLDTSQVLQREVSSIPSGLQNWRHIAGCWTCSSRLIPKWWCMSRKSRISEGSTSYSIYI